LEVTEIRRGETLFLTPKLRQELKNPLGTLIEGAPKQAMARLTEMIRRENPPFIISVGDAVSQNMLKHGIKAQIAIVDHKIMRKEAQTIEETTFRTLNVTNPAGTLTTETWKVMDQALKSRHPIQVFVDGEEDLLTLVAVLEAPENALVVYGQPKEGIVVVKVTEQTKLRVHKIVSAMERNPKS
jgi:uncharacterized protein (UPF0218 family)